MLTSFARTLDPLPQLQVPRAGATAMQRAFIEAENRRRAIAAGEREPMLPLPAAGATDEEFALVIRENERRARAVPPPQPSLPTSLTTSRSSAIGITTSAALGTLVGAAVRSNHSAALVGTVIGFGVPGIISSALVARIEEPIPGGAMIATLATFSTGMLAMGSGDVTAARFFQTVAIGIAIDLALRNIPVALNRLRIPSFLSRCWATFWANNDDVNDAPAAPVQVVVQDAPLAPPVRAVATQLRDNPAAEPLLGGQRPNQP